MANERQVKTGTPNVQTTGSAQVPTAPSVSPSFEEKLLHTLLVGFVTMGYIANKGVPNTPVKLAELDAAVRNVKELL